jgi:hypothetical protein
MKHFLVVGTDGQIEQTGERRAESVTVLCDQIVEEIRNGDGGGDWDPQSYEIYEIVGLAAQIDVDVVEAAIQERDVRLRNKVEEEAKKSREAHDRREYDRLRKKYGDDKS